MEDKMYFSLNIHLEMSKEETDILILSTLTLILLTWRIWWDPNNDRKWQTGFNSAFKALNAELNPICHLLALLGIHHILHVSRIRTVSAGERPAAAHLLRSWVRIPPGAWIFVCCELIRAPTAVGASRLRVNVQDEADEWGNYLRAAYLRGSL